jgi:hypothetical protein
LLVLENLQFVCSDTSESALLFSEVHPTVPSNTEQPPHNTLNLLPQHNTQHKHMNKMVTQPNITMRFLWRSLSNSCIVGLCKEKYKSEKITTQKQRKAAYLTGQNEPDKSIFVHSRPVVQHGTNCTGTVHESHVAFASICNRRITAILVLQLFQSCCNCGLVHSW